MKNATLLKKSTSLERCVLRAREEYAKDPYNLETNFTVQDAVLMNVVRACEQAFDIAQIAIKIKQLPRPDTNKQLFSVLAKAGIINEKLLLTLEGIVGFRNICIHDYEQINMNIVRNVVETKLEALLDFAADVVSFFDDVD